MWDLTKILAATPTVEEAAAERPIFRLDPMIEARALGSLNHYIWTLITQPWTHSLYPGGSGERGGAKVDRAEQGEIFSASKHLVHTGRNK